MNQSEKYVKKYVEVMVDFSADGTMVPKTLIWENGRHYDIDRVKSIQAAPAMKSGGQGDRYTIMIEGQERYLFFEHNYGFNNSKIGKWFVERRS